MCIMKTINQFVKIIKVYNNKFSLKRKLNTKRKTTQRTKLILLVRSSQLRYRKMKLMKTQMKMGLLLALLINCLYNNQNNLVNTKLIIKLLAMMTKRIQMLTDS